MEVDDEDSNEPDEFGLKDLDEAVDNKMIHIAAQE